MDKPSQDYLLAEQFKYPHIPKERLACLLGLTDSHKRKSTAHPVHRKVGTVPKQEAQWRH